MLKRFFSTLLLLAISLLADAQSAHNLLRKGDREYDFENYKEAEQHYRDAADLKYGDPLAQYNLGNALYQQGKWEDAATRFGQAARSTAEPAFKADALHNLGNAFLKQNKFKEAAEAYENSLRLRPGDAETKRNLQMAKKKLEEEKQRMQQEQQQNQQQNQSQNDQNQQGNQQENQPTQGQQPPRQSLQQPQQPEEQPFEKMKKDDAERLLETAIGPEDQKNTRKYRQQRRQPMPNEKKKDW